MNNAAQRSAYGLAENYLRQKTDDVFRMRTALHTVCSDCWKNFSPIFFNNEIWGKKQWVNDE